AVSLQARNSCDQVESVPRNVLRVVHRPNIGRSTRQSTRRSIGVCVKAFRFATFDLSTRLVEWLELIRLLGADNVYFHVYSVNDNMRKVLEHYQMEVSAMRYILESWFSEILFFPIGFHQLPNTILSWISTQH